MRGLVCLQDVLWSDPGPQPNCVLNPRGAGVIFGPDITAKFLKQSGGLRRLVRSHECVDHGVQYHHNKQCVTIFSASDYCGQVRLPAARCAAVMICTCECFFGVALADSLSLAIMACCPFFFVQAGNLGAVFQFTSDEPDKAKVKQFMTTEIVAESKQSGSGRTTVEASCDKNNQ